MESNLTPPPYNFINGARAADAPVLGLPLNNYKCWGKLLRK